MATTSPKLPDVTVSLIGADGNVFNLIGITSRAIKKAGHKDKCQEFTDYVMGASDYDNALVRIMEWVHVQ